MDIQAFTHDDPAPALPALHHTQSLAGRLSRPGLERLADALRLPLVDLYDTATFYHYFGVGDEAPVSQGICGGPACSLRRAASDGDFAAPDVPCPGLCDQPVARYGAGRFTSSQSSADGGFALPHPVDTEEALFRHIRTPGLASLEAYRKVGGYRQLTRLTRGELAPVEALDALQASGLTGRGGAAFPIAAKWRAVREAPGDEKYVVCNADEGEPGTFKDRPILHLDPHLLLESMAIAGYITGASVGIIYLRYEYPDALEVLERAIHEAEDARLLGGDIEGTSFAFRVYIRRGAGSYVCGEETALLNSLEGRRPWPRERPPFPTVSGLWGRPTVINNVETLCCVPSILERGPDWFRSLGRGDNAGTKVYSVSGAVQRPGNYELPLGITARELIQGYAGGPLPGQTLKAFTLGGISGGLLAAEDLDLVLDYDAPRDRAVALGSGGVVVLDDTCCIVDFVRTCMLFYQSESCGRCYPCRIGTTRLRELLEGLTGRSPLPPDGLAQVGPLGDVMTVTSACGLGQSAPIVVSGMLTRFQEEVEEHLRRRRCPAGVCPL